ncbi:AMP-binding protein [Brevibacterium aurantiacum]|uniref:Acetyl-CoA synthetase n=1 Tax=Brevibacterium aurantiacum TaxID=273384 RepID=A0A2H1KNF8_BREAU|nr:AMP-binding protein [Brevibacterium aurantiacum]SMY01138.1 acetyl-CoA synthetase [Brevibacterium aurantiacum]
MSTPPNFAWWQDLTAQQFEWSIPDRFNIARACTDLQPGPDTALIVDDGQTVASYTFDMLEQYSRQMTSVLHELGLDSGDRIGIMVPQGLEVLTAHLGGFRAGIITVPLSIKFGADAVAFRLRDSGARVLIVDAAGFTRIRAGLSELPDLQAVLLVGDAAEATADSPVPVLSFHDIVAAAAPSEEACDTAADDPAIIIYTSGTTGNPKGALHAHRVLPAHMPGVRTTHEATPQPDDVFWTPADWAWIGGLFDVLFPALAMGLPVVATPDSFTPRRAVELIREHRIRNVFMPPTALKQLRSSGVPTDGLHLRTIGSGGEALGQALQDWSQQALGVHINEFYGQTEMNVTIGTCRAVCQPKPGSMGQAFSGFVVRLLDPLGDSVPDEKTGEICVQAPNPGQFLGYWNQPNKTAEKVHEGWIHTGDLGHRDAAGNLWFEGRTDDVISTAGYRVGPGEIEECLLTHPAVAMAAAVGVADEIRGEAVRAHVVLNEGIEPSDELTKQLQDHVKQRLAFYLYPRTIVYLDRLPMTTTGKILRRELRQDS